MSDQSVKQLLTQIDALVSATREERAALRRASVTVLVVSSALVVILSVFAVINYSRFDAEMEGQQIFGMSNQSLPKFDLRIDGKGEIFAEGVDELIYGRASNVLTD